MRIALILAAALSLNGCMNINSLMPEETQQADTSYFLVDTKFRFLCIGDTKECRDMTKIVSSRAELEPIEEAYGKKVTGPNYPLSLARMIMQPENQSYKATPVGSEGRFFSIPVNPQTQLVWDTLTSIEENLFLIGS